MTDYDTSNKELLQLAAKGDVGARDTLVRQNTGLVHSIVRRFSGRGHEAEDLFQIGCIGLIKAVQRFDLSYDVKFSTYAVPMIMGEIKRFIRDDGIIKVSRSIKETAIKAAAERERYMAEYGEEPTVGKLAEILGISTAELATALDAGMAPESLYAAYDDGQGESKPLIERLEQDKDYETEIVNKMVLRQLLNEFEERDKKIIAMRYFKHKTQTQVAELLGISQVQVSRLEKKILVRLREKIEEA